MFCILSQHVECVYVGCCRVFQRNRWSMLDGCVGWMTEDQAYMLLDDELDEYYGVNDGHTQTYVWDVRSLTAPGTLTQERERERDVCVLYACCLWCCVSGD